ncbi:MAG: hypothetical protein SFT94_10320 [Pseudanabaenaceae cyanobacterium bins.68]|nr:hypothetical protein [Pseudanabaenaceae cyanobacterium bins.68]
MAINAALDRQIASLLANAPTDFATQLAVQAIAPVLKTIGLRLRHPRYFIIQDLKHNHWAVSSLRHRHLSGLTKNVAYAYSDRQDANQERLKQAPEHSTCAELELIFLLFQFVSMKELDSLILFEQPHHLNQGTELVRLEIQQLWEAQVQKLRQHLA